LRLFLYNPGTQRKEFFVSTTTKPTPRPIDDEIDLVPLLQALWSSKITVVATTFAGAAISFVLGITSAEQWNASTYITKSSLYSLYGGVKEQYASTSASPPPLDTKLYSSIQNDMFYTAMGVMTANAVTLKETTPKSNNNGPVIYIASTTATTEDRARTLLTSALDSANTDAIKLNLPALAAGNNVRAFNTLDEVKATNSKNPKKFLLLGAFLGLILGSLFVIGRFLTQQYKKNNHAL
jgi:LPS O-antigen subunit length determinant protein (WzzB/FepE family)